VPALDEEATRPETRREAATHPDENRSDVFVFCPYNVANEPRAALPGSHRSSGASAPFACYASELVVGNPSHKHTARSTDAN